MPPGGAAVAAGPAATESGATAASSGGVDPAEAQAILGLAGLAANAFNLGLSGDAFAEQLAYKFGEETYDRIVSAPPEALLAKLRAVPAAWGMLAPWEATLPRFVQEFYVWGQDEEQARKKKPDAPGPQPVPAA